MRRFSSLMGIFLGTWGLLHPAWGFPSKYPITLPLPGPKSPYTDLLLQLTRIFDVADFTAPPGDAGATPVHLQGYETAGHPFYIGVGQWMSIQAPLAQVTAILDDIANYKNLFPDLKETRILEADGNRLLTFWEQKIPVFFIPNIKFEMTYLIDQSRPGWAIYRYQLHRAGTIRLSDGVIFLHADGARTQYAEFDFLDADWGMLEKIAPGRIVNDSTEDLFRSDAAIKLKAENPAWDYDRVRDESERLLKKFPVDRAVKERVPFTLPHRAPPADSAPQTPADRGKAGSGGSGRATR